MGLAGRLIDRASKRTWSAEDVDAILGARRSGHLAHATDPELRSGAASGGAVTALLLAALEQGEIDAALVCDVEVVENRVRPYFVLAETKEVLLRARGSKYVEVNFVRDALPLLREYQGRVAVVGLPCDISTLRRQIAGATTTLRADVVFTIGLFCGHNSTTDLVDMVTDRIVREQESDLAEFIFRAGHWRGRMGYALADGTQGQRHSRALTSYRHLSLFSERKCLSCSDHFAYDADIGAGDVWLYRLKSQPVKHTGLLTRTAAGERIIRLAVEVGGLTVADIDPVVLLDGQARIAPHHHNVAARRSAGRLLGVRITRQSVPDGQRAGLLARFDALLTVAAFRLTASRRGRSIVAALPLRVIRVLAAIKKSLMVVAR